MENRKEKIELLKPKYDVVFQALFGQNEENITQSFISDIIGKPIEIIDIKTDNTIVRKYPEDKIGRLDLKTKFKDGTICQIEMQLANEKNIIDRILYYWSKTFSNQLKRGDTFNKLAQTIGIVIVDFEIKEIKGIEKARTKWQIMETEEGKKILTNKLELYIIEIPKANRILEKESNNKIAQWVSFIDNPNTERVEKIVKNNKEVKKAREVLYGKSKDEELERLAFLKERTIMEENTMRENAKEEGVQEGRRQGIKEGEKRGERISKLEIAKKMKKDKISVEQIQKFTSLTVEEIAQL